jgi:hypothetical protein
LTQETKLATSVWSKMSNNGGYYDDGYDPGYGNDSYRDDPYGNGNDRFDSSSGGGNNNNGCYSNGHSSRDDFYHGGTSQGYSQSSSNSMYSSPNTTSYSPSQASRGQEAFVGYNRATFEEDKPGERA